MYASISFNKRVYAIVDSWHASAIDNLHYDFFLANDARGCYLELDTSSLSPILETLTEYLKYFKDRYDKKEKSKTLTPYGGPVKTEYLMLEMFIDANLRLKLSPKFYNLLISSSFMGKKDFGPLLNTCRSINNGMRDSGYVLTLSDLLIPNIHKRAATKIQALLRGYIIRKS